MIFSEPHLRIMGDRALLVELGDETGPAVSRAVRELFTVLNHRAIPGIRELVPGYCTLLIQYDPLRLPLHRLKAMVVRSNREKQKADPAEFHRHRIPVVYGGSYGPDLQWVAEYHGLTVQEVISLHTLAVYRVCMVGFTPGFSYLGGLPDALDTPRKEKPRTLVPRGSVGIAQKQTGIYPNDSPGGWQILGWTPVTLFDPFKNPPSLLNMGDQVEFTAVTEEEIKPWIP